MNFREVFFFGQYGQVGRMKACAWDHHGVWRRLDGSFMPQPKLIDGVLVCAPGELIERLGPSAVKDRIDAALRRRREQGPERGGQADPLGVPRVPTGAEDATKDKGQVDVRHAQDGGKPKAWAKQWGSKRWHLRRYDDENKGACGRRLLPTKEADTPPWPVACIGCLRAIQRNKRNA